MGTKHFQLPSIDGNYNLKEFEILNLKVRQKVKDLKLLILF